MNKYLIIIPTYNEKGNISSLIEKIFHIENSLDILIIDDNSPDGTGRLVDDLSGNDSRIAVIHRSGKQGLGTAYIRGFKYALEQNYKFVITMDADFSHNPQYLSGFLAKFKQGYDLVVGSRYVPGGGICNWPYHRLFLSKWANLYTRMVTGIEIKDATGGFNGYKVELLRLLNLDKIGANGYGFQIEMKYNIYRKTKEKDLKIEEIPIIFHDRKFGESKLGKGIIKEAFFLVWKLRFRNYIKN
ncbi:polyprenol monophosphomannose synthase [bacterium]|nr:polyprenol monophosphomannose synthase [bacterium]